MTLHSDTVHACVVATAMDAACMHSFGERLAEAHKQRVYSSAGVQLQRDEMCEEEPVHLHSCHAITGRARLAFIEALLEPCDGRAAV